MVSYLTYVGIEMPLGGLESMCFPNKKSSPKPPIEPVVQISKTTLAVETVDKDVEAAITSTTTAETGKGTEKETGIEKGTEKRTLQERVLQQDRETEREEVTEAPLQSQSLSA